MLDWTYVPCHDTLVLISNTIITGQLNCFCNIYIIQERLKAAEAKRIEKERTEKYQKLKGDAKDARAKYREKVRGIWWGLLFTQMFSTSLMLLLSLLMRRKSLPTKKMMDLEQKRRRWMKTLLLVRKHLLTKLVRHVYKFQKQKLWQRKQWVTQWLLSKVLSFGKKKKKILSLSRETIL